jgi:DNA modification methylase
MTTKVKRAKAFRDRVREIREVRIGDLVSNPENFRTHPPEQRAAFRGMLADVGFASVPLVRELPDGTLRLIDGHLRRDEAPEQRVKVAILDVDDDEERRLLATTDPLAAMAGADLEKAEALIAATAEADRERIAAILRTVVPDLEPLAEPPPVVDPNVIPELPPGEPRTKRGDVWVMGPHRLLCGDAFDAADRGRLLESRPVDAVLTDPPYAIYGSASGISSSIADDKMVRPFFEQLFRAIFASVRPFAHVYVHCDWRSYPSLWEGAKVAGLSPKNCLVWDKSGAGLGNNWANTYELVAFFSRLPPQRAMKEHHKGQQRPVLRSNVLRYNRVVGPDREHNAAKPVALLEEIAAAATDPGQVILDLFGGSGSTLIACEKLGRVARVMEVEPAWCDTIVARFERFTGKKAERAKS